MGVRPREQTPRVRPFAHPLQIALGLQFPQRESDPVPSLGETVRKTADVDRCALRQRQDVCGQSDRGQRQLTVLSEVVAHDHVPARLVRAYVRDTGVGGGSPNTLIRARGSVRLLVSHGEGSSSSLVRPSHWDASPGGGRCMCGVVAAPCGRLGPRLPARTTRTPPVPTGFTHPSDRVKVWLVGWVFSQGSLVFYRPQPRRPNRRLPLFRVPVLGVRAGPSPPYAAPGAPTWAAMNSVGEYRAGELAHPVDTRVCAMQILDDRPHTRPVPDLSWSHPESGQERLGGLLGLPHCHQARAMSVCSRPLRSAVANCSSRSCRPALIAAPASPSAQWTPTS